MSVCWARASECVLPGLFFPSDTSFQGSNRHFKPGPEYQHHIVPSICINSLFSSQLPSLTPTKLAWDHCALLSMHNLTPETTQPVGVSVKPQKNKPLSQIISRRMWTPHRLDFPDTRNLQINDLIEGNSEISVILIKSTNPSRETY